MNMVEPIRNKQQLEAMKMFLKGKSIRNYLLFMVGISSALRISDILRLKVKDVWGNNGQPLEYIVVKEKKTCKIKKFPITPNLNKAIKLFMKEYKYEQEEFLFKSRKGNGKPITRQMAAHIISEAADYVGIKERISTHSMRKTWGYFVYKQGVDIAMVMEALNHSSIANTKKYIGITQEDLNDVYIKLNL